MVSASPSHITPQASTTTLRLIARLDIKGAHLDELVSVARPTGVAIAEALHYNRYSLDQIRSHCLANGVVIRTISRATKVDSWA